jgi:hypothetical protein
MKFTTAAVAAALLSVVVACGDDHAHDHSLHRRLPPTAKLAPPTRT